MNKFIWKFFPYKKIKDSEMLMKIPSTFCKHTLIKSYLSTSLKLLHNLETNKRPPRFVDKELHKI